MVKPCGKAEINWHKVFKKLSEAGILLFIPLLKGPLKIEDIVSNFPI